MAKADTLKDYYLALLSDTLSANEQMLAVVGDLHQLATHPELKAMLDKTKDRVPQHNAKLEQLITSQGGKKHAEHCKGMEGIVAEAKEHAIRLKTDDDAVRDAAIIHVMQQMTTMALPATARAPRWPTRSGSRPTRSSYAAT